MNASKLMVIAASALLMASCATHKTVGTTDKTAATVNKTEKTEEQQQIDFLDKVNENASYQKNISAGITFHIWQENGKEMNVPGQLRMRKDEVIRISLQMPLIGSEIGRLEFAKDYVLIVDRIHKEYVKTGYSNISFLRDNGIDFYSLQALFWNRLLLPGKTSVGYTDLSKFKANLQATGDKVPVTLSSGKLKFTWNANRKSGVIDQTKVEYSSKGHGVSSLTWQYGNFTNFGSKPFPYSNTMTVVTPATGKTKTLKAAYDINSISTNSDWSAKTDLSGKYKQVSAEEVLGKLKKN